MAWALSRSLLPAAAAAATAAQKSLTWNQLMGFLPSLSWFEPVLVVGIAKRDWGSTLRVWRVKDCVLANGDQEKWQLLRKKVDVRQGTRAANTTGVFR